MSVKDPINLLKGYPNPALLPIDLIKHAAQAALSDREIAVKALLYGPDPGYEPLREEIARWLNSFYQPAVPIAAERLCISGGASQCMGCILGVYTDPEYTRNVWIVAPAYFLAFQIFEDAGFAGKMRAVPEDEEGLDIAFLEAAIAKSEEDARRRGNLRSVYKPDRERAKVYKHVVYCVPTFANPTSRTMSLARRKDLLRVARDYDALVVTDDVYDFLQWPVAAKTASTALQTAHMPRLVDLDDAGDGFGNTCSNGSFSKIAGPGLRTGWVEGTKKFTYGMSQAGVQRSGGAPSQLTSTYVSHLLETGKLQRHISETLQPAYARRYAKLMKAIDEHLLPLGFTLPQAGRDVVGGYFVWLGLPLDMAAVELEKKCLEEGVIVIIGQKFEVPGDDSITFAHSIRLCLAWEEEDLLPEGVKRIAKAAQELLKSQYVLVRSSESEGVATI